ncbi:probable methyltransferase-like protein 24 [Triplophysa rosa]|uniref:Methyltransferase-like protein 24 n=1 Tax=Triplophysa rosa TaxID=992332 RepID=A0A9W7TNK6_TRIRA|nr:probable methyltransferase-like protein 24 [Triplophysa rosa]KAI7799327.1 putative methyltransferase-like protein 24 [Triplophysa rosa]
MKKCFVLRSCLLLSLLCICAHIYVEFKDFWLKIWMKAVPSYLTRHRSVAKTTSASSDAASTCCPAVKHHRKAHRWKIALEPWAAATHNLEEEANRFIKYISTPKVSCERRVSWMFDRDDERGSWVLCLDSRFSLYQRIDSKHCRVYSLRLGSEDDGLERSLAVSGCEVHCFDPSIRGAHLQDSHMWFHKLSVDWRDPNPAGHKHSNTKKLATILNDFGHRQVDVLKLDMESAEWKILENLILEDVLGSIGLLLLEVHLHWAGFEVGGDEPSVVRYWFSLLRELERAHFLLYHSYSDPTKPHVFLQRNFQNTSSSYILGWVNTHFSPHT